MIDQNDPIFIVLFMFAIIGMMAAVIVIGKLIFETAERLNDMEYDIRRLKARVEEIEKK